MDNVNYNSNIQTSNIETDPNQQQNQSNQPGIQPDPTQPADTKKHNSKAIIALILGIFGLIAWFIPLFGAPITITGLILGIIGLKSSKRGLAIAAIVLCSIGLLLTIINASIGAYMGVTGQHTLLNTLFDKTGQSQQTNTTSIESFDESSSKSQIINQMVQEAKSQITLPNQVDEVTKLVDITAESEAIRYHYVLSGIDVSNLSNESFKQGLVANICTNNDTLSLLNQDIQLEYSYIVENSGQTYFVSILKADCK